MKNNKEDAKILREISESPLGNPVRLAVALYLLPRKGAYFTAIAKALGLTKGNLRHHLNIMLKQGLIEEKYVLSNRPRKYISLTTKGAVELNKILNLLEKLLGMTRS